MERSIKKIIFTCLLGYLLILATAIVLTIIIKLVTGYFPSFDFFTLALITFRLSEINQFFIVTPFLVAILTMLILCRALINNRITSGISMAFYYFLVTIFFVITGSGDFPFWISTIWIVWVFNIGVISSIIVDKLCIKR
ncbi:MAG: hypothetical protein O2U61_05390 [Candidatus Bathyarchaeota archaeon]|nr:hypothetical protein [Candidatus Bathyarchaeota archaeon]MCZ2845915.1 hypothetical protein [Candidatus Bathyarchaeota archaeon]